jgi:hypothetical protein
MLKIIIIIIGYTHGYNAIHKFTLLLSFITFILPTSSCYFLLGFLLFWQLLLLLFFIVFLLFNGSFTCCIIVSLAQVHFQSVIHISIGLKNKNFSSFKKLLRSVCCPKNCVLSSLNCSVFLELYNA